MQKWEYMTWNLSYGNGLQVLERNGQTVPNWMGGPNLFDALNQAGAEGWELVAAYCRESDHYYNFKRLKP